MRGVNITPDRLAHRAAMETTQHIAALRRESALLAEAAAQTSPDAAVPTCPDWQLRGLVRHIGGVHRWATAYLVHGHRERLDPDAARAAVGPAPDDSELVDWLRAGSSTLAKALENAPEDLECWSFLPAPSSLAFWARRQAQETATAIHRVDAELAAGLTPTAVDPVFAEDGLDELLLPSRARVRSEQPRTLLIRPDDWPASWLVTIGQDSLTVAAGDTAECTISGTAHDLYLLLWNRLPLDAAKLTGDGAVAELWQENARI